MHSGGVQKKKLNCGAGSCIVKFFLHIVYALHCKVIFQSWTVLKLQVVSASRNTCYWWKKVTSIENPVTNHFESVIFIFPHTIPFIVVWQNTARWRKECTVCTVGSNINLEKLPLVVVAKYSEMYRKPDFSLLPIAEIVARHVSLSH